MPFHTVIVRWVVYTSPTEVNDVPFVDSLVIGTPASARRGAYEIGWSQVVVEDICPG